MRITFIYLFTILPLMIFSQKYERKIYDYSKFKTDSFAECDETLLKELERCFTAVTENQSKVAVKIAKDIYDKNKSCYEVFEVYGYSLFKSGEWFEGLEILEKGIEKFGSVPELIKRRSNMSLEMAQLGTGQKNIDGSSVYKANSVKYDEEQFKEENFKSALLDLEYLMTNYRRSEEVFFVAKIRQILKEYDVSTQVFQTLLNDQDYKYAASFNIADNYIAQNNYKDAEAELNKLLAEDPKVGEVHNKLAEVYEQKKDEQRAKEHKNMAVYYNNIPDFLNMDYSKDNFDLLIFFGDDAVTAKDKLKKLDEIVKKNDTEHTIDVCLMILKLHTNHGNGVEEKATEILAGIGKPSIKKVNKLFQYDVSTCTITNLADVMASVKDDSSWVLMKSYLAYIEKMPMTLIPPNLPEKMVKFDEDKGIKEILLVVKPLLNANKNNEDPMAQLNSFGQYIYYSPLKKIKKSKLKKIAAEANYSDDEFKKLQEKIK